MKVLEKIIKIILFPFKLLGLIFFPFVFRPHYRKGKSRLNQGHIAYLHNKKGKDIDFVSLTHDDKYGNLPLERNPNPNETDKAFIHPYNYTAQKSSFHKEKKKDFLPPTENDKAMIKGLPKTTETPNEVFIGVRKKAKKKKNK